MTRDELKAEALRLYDYHGNIKRVGAMLHIPSWWVTEWLRERGLPHKWRRRRDPRVAESLKIVRECHEDKMGDTETAKEMGVSREYVRQMREFLELPPLPRKKRPRRMHGCRLCKTECRADRVYCGDACARRGIAAIQRGARPDVKQLADLVLEKRTYAINMNTDTTMVEIAHDLGISQAYAHKLMRRFHPHAPPMPSWSGAKRAKQIEQSRANDAKVLAFLKQGKTLKEAADLAGVGYASARDVMLDSPFEGLGGGQQEAADDPGSAPERGPQVQRA